MFNRFTVDLERVEAGEAVLYETVVLVDYGSYVRRYEEIALDYSEDYRSVHVTVWDADHEMDIQLSEVEEIYDNNYRISIGSDAYVELEIEEI